MTEGEEKMEKEDSQKREAEGSQREKLLFKTLKKMQEGDVNQRGNKQLFTSK